MRHLIFAALLLASPAAGQTLADTYEQAAAANLRCMASALSGQEAQAAYGDLVAASFDLMGHFDFEATDTPESQGALEAMQAARGWIARCRIIAYGD